jgi:hypothetical protein
VREDGEYAGKSAGLSRVDADDARVCVIRVTELRVQLAGEIEVGGIPSGPRHLLFSIRTHERGRVHPVTLLVIVVLDPAELQRRAREPVITNL